jgi:hypothetical protein
MNWLVFLVYILLCLIERSYGGNLLAFGNADVGTFFSVGPTAEKYMIFYHDDNLNIISIQIENTRYGATTGGKEAFRAMPDSEGRFHLRRLELSGKNTATPLNFFSAVFNEGYEVYAGGYDHGNFPINFESLQPNGTSVKLTGLGADTTGIYLMQFEINGNISFVFGSAILSEGRCTGFNLLQPGALSYSNCDTITGPAVCGLAINDVAVCGSGSDNWKPLTMITNSHNNLFLQEVRAVYDIEDKRYISYMKGTIEKQPIEIGHKYPLDGSYKARGSLILYDLPLTLIGMYRFIGTNSMDSMIFSNFENFELYK